MSPSWVSWLSSPAVLGSLAVCSVVAVLASVLLVPRYLAGLPEDYLVSAEHHAPSQRPFWFRVGKNLLGAVLVGLGVLMLALPGQGLVTLLVGVMCLDFPGKQRLLQRLLGQKKALALINRLRQRLDRVPLRAPD